jgi:hypothetical protein
MDRFKVLNIVIVVTAALVAFGTKMYWKYMCIQGGCTYYLNEAFFQPSYWGSIALAIIIGSFIFYQSKLFKHWLIQVASWAIPLWVFFTMDQNPLEHGFLGIGRSEIVWLVGVLFFILTSVYIILWHLYFWKKGSIERRDLLKLLWLIIPALLFKFGWQLF